MDEENLVLFQEPTQLFDTMDQLKSAGTLLGSQYSYDTTSMFRFSNHRYNAPRDSNNANTYTFSTFGDTECGEPMHSQHLVLDFTPTDRDEDEQVRQKCLDFWDFFYSNPKLQSMVVEPEADSAENDSQSDLASSVPTEESKQEPTALDILDEFGQKDIFAGLLSCKMAGSGCSLRSREYREHDPVTRGMASAKLKQSCRCIGVCACDKSCKKKKVAPPHVQYISKSLNQWTLDNPKSMEPPGHPPELKQATMQRKMSTIALSKSSRSRRTK